jgi:hypothetical protein
MRLNLQCACTPVFEMSNWCLLRPPFRFVHRPPAADDLLFIWLVLLNEYVTPVPEVANTTKGTDLPSLVCMIKNCGQKIVDCVSDTRCKAGLDCLEGCAFNDQVMNVCFVHVYVM